MDGLCGVVRIVTLVLILFGRQVVAQASSESGTEAEREQRYNSSVYGIGLREGNKRNASGFALEGSSASAAHDRRNMEFIAFGLIWGSVFVSVVLFTVLTRKSSKSRPDSPPSISSPHDRESVSSPKTFRPDTPSLALEPKGETAKKGRIGKSKKNSDLKKKRFSIASGPHDLDKISSASTVNSARSGPHPSNREDAETSNTDQQATSSDIRQTISSTKDPGKNSGGKTLDPKFQKATKKFLT